jgi:hypothetical protein
MMDTKKMRECSSLLPDPGGEVVRKCLDEIERLTAHILELENELAAGVHTCGPTCRKTPVCAERADLREAIRSCLVYWLGGESPDDCPHTVAKIKALCDWDSQLPAARSAP